MWEIPTKPANDPPNATAYSITDDKLAEEIRDGFCNIDVGAEERSELENSYVGAGCRMKLSAKQLQHATIAGNVPTIVLDSRASSLYVNLPAEEMQASECGEIRGVRP